MTADPIGMLDVDDGHGTSGASGGQVIQTTELVSLAAAAGVVAALCFVQAILVPVVLACLLGILLQPLVNVLERWKLGRFPSVLISGATATIFLAVVLGVVTYQVIQHAGSHSPYQSNIEQKVRLIRDAPSGALNRLRALFSAVEQSTLDPEAQAQPGLSSRRSRP